MTSDYLNLLKQIYSQSVVPTAIADGCMNIIWRNRAAETGCSLLKHENALFIFRNKIPAAGVVCFADNDAVHRVNVLKVQNNGDKAFFYIMEYMGSDCLRELLEAPDIKNYMTYLCARIRESAGMIAVSADEIDSVAAAFGPGCGEVTDQLNSINRGLMLILREVIDPEQLYYILDPHCDDVTLCIEDEVAQAAADARRSLGRSVKVSCNTEKGIYTRMNRSVFETIMADMAAECCNCEFYPEELIFSCEKLSAERIAITVRCVNISGMKNKVSKFDRNRQGSRIYFDYLCSVMCGKYGAEFTRNETDSGYCCRMEINTSLKRTDKPIVMSRSKFSIRSERFCPMTLLLAEQHIEDRYKKVNIDGI